MTDREILELILNKMASFEQRQDRFEAKLGNFEAKLDTVADVAQIKKDVSLLLEHDDIDTFNINSGYKEIKEVNSKLDKVIADQKLDWCVTQASISQLQAQVSTIEDRLDKAS